MMKDDLISSMRPTRCKLHLSVCYSQRLYPRGIFKYVMARNNHYANYPLLECHD
jgi:hypothetical protein